MPLKMPHKATSPWLLKYIPGNPDALASRFRPFLTAYYPITTQTSDETDGFEFVCVPKMRVCLQALLLTEVIYKKYEH